MQYDEEALWRVKIGHFLKRGIPIRGVIHVGANDGYEIDWYLKLGIKHVFAVEPESSAFEKLTQKFKGVSEVLCYLGALGDTECLGVLKVPEVEKFGSTNGSTLLTELPLGRSVMGMDYDYRGRQEVAVTTFARLAALFPDVLWPGNYNCLVIDVQGMELQVLKGFGSYLNGMDCLNIECSETPIYEGEAPASEVVAWLGERGFEAISPIEPHNDILFVKRGKEEVLSG